MQQVKDILNHIQQELYISNKNIQRLIEYFKKDPKEFVKTIIYSGLKYKKTSSLFEKLFEKFFSELYQEYISNNQNNQQIHLSDISYFFQDLLKFFCEGVDSPNSYARIIAGKSIINLLKIIKQNQINEIIDKEHINILISKIIYLLQLKQQNIKLISLKIASLIQSYQNLALNQEILKCMCQDDTKDIRKAALITIDIVNNKQNLNYFLDRTRDIDNDVRILLFKKLIKDQIYFKDMNLPQKYKLIYDGLYSRDQGVQYQVKQYIRFNYEYNKQQLQDIQIYCDNISNMNISPTKQHIIGYKLYLQIAKFLEMFELENSLVNNEIHDTMAELCEVIIKEIIGFDNIIPFVERIMKLMEPRQITKEVPSKEELFLFRILCQIIQKDDKNMTKHLKNTIEDNFPNGNKFAHSIQNIWNKRGLFEIKEILIISEIGYNFEEASRCQLLDTFKNILCDLEAYQCFDFQKQQKFSNNITYFNDLYSLINQDDIYIKKYQNNCNESKLIFEINDLIPYIVKILRKLLSDVNNEFSKFIIQTISEINSPLVDTNIQCNIHYKKQILQNTLQTYDKEINQIKEQIQQLQKINNLECQTQINKLNNQLILYSTQKDNILDDIQKLNKRINQIVSRCLMIAISLLQQSRFSLKDSGISGLLTQFIGPCFQIEDQYTKDQSLQCLALYVMLDKQICFDYLQVFKHVLDEYESSDMLGSTPSEIIAISALFDYGLIYDIFIQENISIDKQQILNYLIKYICQSEIYTKNLCLEGFSKLLFNDKLDNQIDILIIFMIIWHDTCITTFNRGDEAIQLLSMFFKTYIESSQQKLFQYEKALEIFVYLLLFLNESKEYQFNRKFVVYNINEVSLLNYIKIGIILLNYTFNKNNEAFHNDIIVGHMGPIERFFVYLCILSRNQSNLSKTACQIFSRVLSQFDFINKTQKDTLLIINYFLSDLIKCLQEEYTVQFKIFQQILMKQFQKANNQLNDDLLTQQINDQQYINEYIQNIETDINNLKIEIANIIKNFQSKDIIVNKYNNRQVIEQDYESPQNVNSNIYIEQFNESQKQNTNQHSNKLIKIIDDLSISIESNSSLNQLPLINNQDSILNIIQSQSESEKNQNFQLLQEINSNNKNNENIQQSNTKIQYKQTNNRNYKVKTQTKKNQQIVKQKTKKIKLL